MESNASGSQGDGVQAALGDEGATVCAICLESPELAVLPCCGGGSVAETSSTRFCQPCIEVICRMGGGLGTCPRCRGRLMVQNGKVIVPPQNLGQCRMCRQSPKQLVDKGLCDPCLMGSGNPIRYTCDRCHNTQRIAHPMYRYQSSPAEYSTASWACHQGCNDYTHWRIVPQQLHKVPVADRPASWGNEDWFAEVRRARREERAASGDRARCVAM